tara:strand:+ start:632 stop:766 length:135 start_codon:yes stop_codon:yes gene_type:complete
MENKNYIMRGNCWLDAIMMERYTQQYIDTPIGLENDEEHRELGS